MSLPEAQEVLSESKRGKDPTSRLEEGEVVSQTAQAVCVQDMKL